MTRIRLSITILKEIELNNNITEEYFDKFLKDYIENMQDALNIDDFGEINDVEYEIESS